MCDSCLVPTGTVRRQYVDPVSIGWGAWAGRPDERESVIHVPAAYGSIDAAVDNKSIKRCSPDGLTIAA